MLRCSRIKERFLSALRLLNFKSLVNVSSASLLLFLLLAYFPIFLHLDSAPVSIWDESLFAMRAYFMLMEGGYLPNFDYFPGMTNYPNLKPPLGTFFQALSFKLFGFNELALRLPIALFVLSSCALLLRWGWQLGQSLWIGIAASLILLTSTGYVSPHVARTGDQDVMLAFWVFAATYAFYQYYCRKKAIFLWLMTACLLAAFFTKSIVAFFFLPGYLVFLISQKQLGFVLRQKQLYLNIITSVGIIVGYYLVMDHHFPGFWRGVSETVFGRYTAERNGLHQAFYYYFKQLATREFVPWIALLFIQLIQLWRLKKQYPFFELCILLWCCLLSHLFIISFSATKLSWYEAAIYLPAALLASISFYQCLQIKPWTRGVMVVGILAFAVSYYHIVDEAMHFRLRQPHEKMAYLMKKIQRQHPDIKAYTIYSQAFNGQVAFYAQVMNAQQDYNIQVMTFWEDQLNSPGGYVMLYNNNQLNRAREVYELELVDAYEEVRLFRLKEKDELAK
jgi:4-amino-4-deoxy-L-arabinose transferase-like glycosyltransferase